MLQDLFAWMESADAEGDVWVRLAEARWTGPAPGGAKLVLRFGVRVDDTPLGTVEMLAEGVREHALLEANDSSISFMDERDHVAVLQHTDVREELYLRPPDRVDVAAALGALYLEHRAVAGPWIDFERYLNRGMAPESLLAQQSLIAHGPAFLLAGYRRALAPFGYVTHVLDAGAPKWWDGQHWQEQVGPLAMLSFGSSRVIAERFSTLSMQG